MTALADRTEFIDPVPLLQRLVRFRSVNPPGDEGECVRFIADLLESAGAGVRLIARDDDRPNLVATFAGAGRARPLLLHAHADVVPTDGQQWTHPPFCGDIIDGHVWGRGSVDMKGGLAMMVSALLRMYETGQRPAGDVILALSPDEEAGSEVGARFLVAEHPELFDSVAYAIGEDGGAVLTCLPRRVHPIVVAEKRACWSRVALRGRGGHASRQGWSGTAMAELAGLLGALTDGWLPTHVTPAAERMLTTLADAADDRLATALRALAAGERATAPKELLPEADAVYLNSVVRHTVNATIVRTPDKINVLPNRIEVDLDGRILPGAWTVADFQAELRTLIGPEADIEVLLEGDAMPAPVFGDCYDSIVDVLREADPDGLPVPMVTPASTDARLFAGRLGIACYGWQPMLVPVGSRYQDAMHAADERLPVDALRFGTDCMRRLLLQYR